MWYHAPRHPAKVCLQSSIEKCIIAVNLAQGMCPIELNQEKTTHLVGPENEDKGFFVVVGGVNQASTGGDWRSINLVHKSVDSYEVRPSRKLSKK